MSRVLATIEIDSTDEDDLKKTFEEFMDALREAGFESRVTVTSVEYVEEDE